MSEEFKNPFAKSGDLMSQLKKAKEEQDQKIAEEKARIAEEQRKKEREEKERLEREEEARRKEQEEKERLERERIAAEKRQQEEERRKREAEERAKAEEEKRRIAEEQKREEQAKNKLTLEVGAKIENLLEQMKVCESKGLKNNTSELIVLINQFNELNKLNVYYDKINSYQEAYKTYQNIINLRDKINYIYKKRKAKRQCFITILILSILFCGLIGVIYGLKKYHATEQYQEKLRIIEQEKEASEARKNEARIAKQQEKTDRIAQKEAEKAKKQAEKEYKKKLKSYKVGGWGEYGVIFYDKGSYSDGWRFLEVHPNITDNTMVGEINGKAKGLETEIGKGDLNLTLLNEVSGYSIFSQLYEDNGEDWYIGNIAEMKLLYTNLVDKSKRMKKIKKYVEEGKMDKLFSTYMDNFLDNGTICYITSEQKDEDYTYVVCFSTNKWILNGGSEMAIGNSWSAFKHNDIDGYCAYVRLIRKF